MSPGADPAAQALPIYAATLRVLTAALWRGDGETFATYCRTPFDMICDDDWERYETDADLIAAMLAYRDLLDREGVATLERDPIEAACIAPGRILGCHRSRFLTGDGGEARPSYIAQMTLVADGGIWRAAATDCSVSADDWPVVKPGATGRAAT